MEATKENPERDTPGSTDGTRTTSGGNFSQRRESVNGDGDSQYSNIPAELKELRQWVGWRLGKPNKQGKRSKVPVNPATGNTAAVNAPTTWGTFTEAAFAVAAVTRYKLAGLGFVFTREDPYAGIDVDGCRKVETGELNPLAHDTMQRVVSYTEASPSGKGIHIIAKGTLPAGGGNNGTVEMYDTGRFFTFTGEHIGGTPTEIEAQQAEIDALYREQFPEKLNGKAKQDKPKKARAKQAATLREVAEALPFIPADEHDVWLQVGMALHSVDSGEDGFALWVEWSKRCPEKFDLEDCHKRWRSFTPAGGITAATIFGLAVDHGWRNSARTEHGNATSETGTNDRPTIPITTDITHVVNEAEHALLKLPHGPHLFQRINQLCFVTHSAIPPKWLKRPVGAPTISACSPAQLRERMSQAADWVKWDARSEAWTAALPPEWAVKTLHERRAWGFPILADVIASPTLREDGEIISAPGYDWDTGLFLDTQGVIFPPIPPQPTLDEARRAVEALTEPFADFPFAGPYGLSAALSGILSLVARPAIAGCVPLFAVDSTTRGTGKGLLIDVGSTIATGRLAPRWAQTRDEEEDRKALLTIGMEGDACVHIDNLTHPLGSGPLDSALTAGVIKGRLLGLNKSAEAPMNCVFFASGNNISFVGDTARRVVPIQLESLEEHPENREDFQQPRLLEWVRKERLRLVVEALTLLRAYFVAGCPKQRLSAYGSFEAWSDLIRSALVWAGCADPCEGRALLEAASDPGYENLARLLHCWAACYGNHPVTLSSVIGDVGLRSGDTSSNEWNELGESLAAFDDRYDGKRLDGKRIGYGLRTIKGRVVAGMRLIQTGKSHGGVTTWGVQQV